MGKLSNFPKINQMSFIQLVDCVNFFNVMFCRLYQTHMIFRKLSKVSWYKNFRVIVKNKSTTTLQCITQSLRLVVSLKFSTLLMSFLSSILPKDSVFPHFCSVIDHIRQQKNKKWHSTASLLAVNSLVSVSKHLYLT